LQLSFVVLSRVTVVTHAVANAFRRPAVIVASIIQFNTQISFINSVGVAIACGGVLLYSYVKSTIKVPITESVGGAERGAGDVSKPKSS
jgi:solute carrier family 35 protein E1